MVKIRGEIQNATQSAGLRPQGERAGKSLVDNRDYKVTQMPEGCNAEQFKKWRHDVIIFLEAHPSWKGARRILGWLRKENKVVTEEILHSAITKANADSFEESGYEVASHGEWTFSERTRELY